MNQLEEYEIKWGISQNNPHKTDRTEELISFYKSQLDITNVSTTVEIQSKFNDYIDNIVVLYNDLKALMKLKILKSLYVLIDCLKLSIMQNQHILV